MTSTSQALVPLFEGKQIRVLFDTITGTGEPWFPLTDLASAWGTDPAAPYHIVERNPEVFQGFCRSSCDIDVTATSGKCLNERGLYLLMGKISAGRLKNPEARAAIIRFQRWVPELIQQYRKKEIVQSPAVPALDTELQQATRIAELTGTDPRVMQAAALRKCGLKEYADALTPSLIHGEAGAWLNSTQIGARCGHSARDVNNFLEWHRFQYRSPDGLWRLTDKGELHGEEYEYPTVNKHIEIRIRWRESILTASGLVKELPSQTALPARA